MMKSKQIEYLIQSLPIPEPEEVQVRPACLGNPHMARRDADAFPSSLPPLYFGWSCDPKAARLATLEDEMQRANQDYAAAVARASTYHTIPNTHHDFLS